MKILFCTRHFPPRGSGLQTGGTISNLNLVVALARSHEVGVLSFDPTSKPEAFSGEQFTVFQRPAPVWGALALFQHWLPFVREETQKCLHQTGKPDILLATTSTLAALDVAPINTKRVAMVRAFENFGYSCRHVPLRTRINLAKGAVVRKFQDGRLLREADTVLTNSAFMRDAIARRFSIHPSAIDILPQQVDVCSTSTLAPEQTIGFVHRGPDKNISLVTELARRSPHLRFVVYGHGAHMPDKLPKNMELRGWNSDRDSMFASASLWLVPSLWAEPFGRVSIEAQAADRAVLVADHGGLPETVFDPRFRIAGFDPKHWLNRIHELLQIPHSELVQNGEKVRLKFSADTHDKSVSEVLSRILEG